MDDLAALLAQAQVSDEDRRRARSMALLATGLGLLGAPRGQELQSFGRAGLLGIQNYNEELQQLRRDKLAEIAARNAGMDVLAKQQAFKDREAARAVMAQPLPTPQQVAAGGMPSLAPTVANADVLAQRTAALPHGVYGQLMGRAQQFATAGLPEKAQEFTLLAEKYRPKYDTTPRYGTDANGKRYAYILDDQGNERRLQAGPDLEKLHFADTGGLAGVGLDPFSGAQASPGIPKTMTPSEIEANKIAQANLALARQREGREAAAGQIVETPQGYARVGKDNTVTPILTGEGQLQPKPTGAVTQQIASNNVTLQKLDRAEKLIQEYPDAFGLQNLAGDTVMQRVDPRGVEARAMIADIAGQKIHDRSGAAVTVGEAQRLKPYVPNPTDNAETVQKKLTLFRREYEAMQRELFAGKPLAAVTGGGGESVLKTAERPTSEADYAKLPSGAEYTAPDGTRRRKR